VDTLSIFTDIAVILGVVLAMIGGTWATVRLIINLGRWTDSVSRGMTDNAGQVKELAQSNKADILRLEGKIDAALRAIDRIEHRVERLEEKP
jgi:hypothetical protein